MKLILHSVSYAGLWPGQARLTLDEFIPHAAQLGYDGVMLVAKRPHLSLLDYPSGDAEKRARVRRLAEEHRVAISCLAGYTDFTAGHDHTDIPVWEHQVAALAGQAELARDLGCSLIRVFTSYDRPSVPHGAAWGRTVEALREAAIQCARYGVTLAVQNHHELALHHESMYQLLKEIDHPNCRAGFDAWAPALHGLRGAALADAVKKMSPFVVHTTVADYQARPRYAYQPDLINYVPVTPLMAAVPMGEGIIDYPTFFNTLIDEGFDGTVAYEMCSPLVDGGALAELDRYARSFVEYMAPFTGKISAAGSAASRVAVAAGAAPTN